MLLCFNISYNGVLSSKIITQQEILCNQMHHFLVQNHEIIASIKYKIRKFDAYDI